MRKIARNIHFYFIQACEIWFICCFVLVHSFVESCNILICIIQMTCGRLPEAFIFISFKLVKFDLYVVLFLFIRSLSPVIFWCCLWHFIPYALNMVLQKHIQLDRVKRIWYLSPMRAAKVQASLRICAVSPEPSLLAHTSSESRGTFRQKARSLAPLNGWACAVKFCHDVMLEDTNSLDGAQLLERLNINKPPKTFVFAIAN